MKEAMMAAIEKANLPIAKLTAIITNGAPAMIGSVNGLVGLCKADQTFSEFWSFHSQGATGTYIIEVGQRHEDCNDNRQLHPHTCIIHRQFKNLITELDQGLPGDLLLHCTVRWLSKSQVLSHFFQLLDAVKLFMKEKNKNYPELSDLE